MLLKYHDPTPVFVSEPLPLHVALKTPEPDPVKVSLRFVFETFEILVEVNVNVPVPDASKVAPLAPTVNTRSVDVAAPVYCNVPPLITKLAAALVDCPIPLDAPPLANVLTDKMPPLMVVTPV